MTTPMPINQEATFAKRQIEPSLLLTFFLELAIVAQMPLVLLEDFSELSANCRDPQVLGHFGYKMWRLCNTFQPFTIFPLTMRSVLCLLLLPLH